MCEIGASTGKPSTGIARTSAKMKKPRGISFEQFTGERDPFELSTSITRHRSATLGARATSGLKRELTFPCAELTTVSGGAHENVIEYGGRSAEHDGGSASLREESPAARIKARHEREEKTSATDDPRESHTVQLQVCCNRQPTSSNTSDSGAGKSLAAGFRASHERHAHRGGERRHAVLLHARLEHHLYMSDSSDPQQIRDTPAQTCGFGGNGSGYTVEEAQRPQHNPSLEIHKNNDGSCSRPSHSFDSADLVIKVDDLDSPMMRVTGESVDSTTGLSAARDAFNGFGHYVPHFGTPVSTHGSMSTSPPVSNSQDNPGSQLPFSGFPYTSGPVADTRHDAGPRLLLSRRDASGPTSHLPRSRFDGNVVPTDLRRNSQTHRECLFKDGLISPLPGHEFDEHGIPLTSCHTIQRDLDGLCKVVPGPEPPAALVASTAIPSQSPLPSAAASPGLPRFARPPPEATDTKILTQVTCTPRQILIDTHSICAAETLGQNAVHSQYADSFLPENLRPAPQILRYGPFQTQQAHQSRNTPLGSGRLQNASKSSM